LGRIRKQPTLLDEALQKYKEQEQRSTEKQNELREKWKIFTDNQEIVEILDKISKINSLQNKQTAAENAKREYDSDFENMTEKGISVSVELVRTRICFTRELEWKEKEAEYLSVKDLKQTEDEATKLKLHWTLAKEKFLAVKSDIPTISFGELSDPRYFDRAINSIKEVVSNDIPNRLREVARALHIDTPLTTDYVLLVERIKQSLSENSMLYGRLYEAEKERDDWKRFALHVIVRRFLETATREAKKGRNVDSYLASVFQNVYNKIKDESKSTEPVLREESEKLYSRISERIHRAFPTSEIELHRFDFDEPIYFILKGLFGKDGIASGEETKELKFVD
jgi:hypothetical protein